MTSMWFRKGVQAVTRIIGLASAGVATLVSLVYNLADPARPVLAAIRHSLVTKALYPQGNTGVTAALTGCLVPSYAIGFAPDGRALTVVMDRGMPDSSSRDTVLTWQVTASGGLRDLTETARNTWDGLPALAPDGRTVIDGQVFGGTKVRLWEVPPATGEKPR